MLIRRWFPSIFFLHLKEVSLLSHFKTVHTTFRRQSWPFRLELGYCAGYWGSRLDSFQDFWSLSHVIEAVSPETIQICLLTEIASSLPTANKGCSEARLVKDPILWIGIPGIRFWRLKKRLSHHLRSGRKGPVSAFAPSPPSLKACIRWPQQFFPCPLVAHMMSSFFFFFVICSRKSLPLEIYKVFSIFIIDMCPPLLPKCN